MGKYAEGTTVTADRSRVELQRILERYGADQFAFSKTDDGDAILFRARGRFVRFDLTRPPAADFRRTKGGQRRNDRDAAKAAEREYMRRWRVLVLRVTAKLDAIESGDATFDEEFMANLMLPDGSTFGAWAQPEIDAAYERGAMPAGLMPALSAPGGDDV